MAEGAVRTDAWVTNQLGKAGRWAEAMCLHGFSLSRGHTYFTVVSLVWRADHHKETEDKQKAEKPGRELLGQKSQENATTSPSAHCRPWAEAGEVDFHQVISSM